MENSCADIDVPPNPDDDVVQGGGGAEKAAQCGIWVKNSTWQQLRILRIDVGVTWDQLYQILIEQLLTSGLVSAEGREALHKVCDELGRDIPKESGWRRSYGIGEPWPEVAACHKEMLSELKKLTTRLADLSDAVDEHAMAMIEAEPIRNMEVEP